MTPDERQAKIDKARKQLVVDTISTWPRRVDSRTLLDLLDSFSIALLQKVEEIDG